MSGGRDQPTEPRYVPAAGRALLTRLYDPAMALTMREGAWRPALRDRAVADVAPGGTLLEVGAGTGALAIDVAAARPDLEVVAVDGDPEALAIGRAKRGAERVAWREGLADRLPVHDGTVGVIVMSLLLHHLVPDGKRAALAEASRVLRPGGHLHVADWGRPRGLVPNVGFALVRALDGLPNTRDHAAGRLPSLLADAGFQDVEVWRRLRTPWGTLELLVGTCPRGLPA